MNILLKHLQVLLLRDLDTMRREIDLFPDDELIWTAPPGIINPAGTLALHVCGNLRHYIGHVLGGTDYVRNRALEFSQRSASRNDIAEEIEKAKSDVAKNLSSMDPLTLQQEYPESVGGVTFTTHLFLLHLSTHLASHVGQAGYLRRILTGETLSAAPTSIKGLGV